MTLQELYQTPMFKLIRSSALIVLVGIILFVYKTPLQNSVESLYAKIIPSCASPIVYSIGSFDTRFGISQADFIKDLAAAEAIWEKKAGKQLFTYDQTKGKLKVNLIYDYRQEATDKLKSYGLTISSSKASYSALKKQYDALSAQHEIDLSNFKQSLATFQAEQDKHNQDALYWNNRGGAPADEYNKLTQEQATLAAVSAQLDAQQKTINSDADTINAMISVLNRQVDDLNLNIAHFNETGASRGGEFEEGVYESDSKGRRISIYEYTTQDELIRVLAHELGHALGLGHVSDPQAIMYKLNQSKNKVPTQADMNELKKVCKL